MLDYRSVTHNFLVGFLTDLRSGDMFHTARTGSSSSTHELRKWGFSTSRCMRHKVDHASFYKSMAERSQQSTKTFTIYQKTRPCPPTPYHQSKPTILCNLKSKQGTQNNPPVCHPKELQRTPPSFLSGALRCSLL